MFDGITRATMYFFNTNPSGSFSLQFVTILFGFHFNVLVFLIVGRILNRFSKDMGSIDEVLPSALIDCVQV